MENSNTPAQTQEPPVAEIVKAAGLEPTEPMVEAATQALRAAACDPWDALHDWRSLARAALIAGIAAALEEGR